MKHTASPDVEVTVPALVRSHGTNAVTLYRLIQAGRIKARRDEFGRWQVSLESFNAWNSKRLKWHRERLEQHGGQGTSPRAQTQAASESDRSNAEI